MQEHDLTDQMKATSADIELVSAIREEGAALLDKPAQDLTANELRLLLLAAEQKEVVEENESLKGRVEELEAMVYTDVLTDMKNRRYLQALLDRDTAAVAQSHAERRQTKDGDLCTAVLLIDLNGFKRINDDYGHGAGDKALQAVAEALRHTLRSEDNAVALPASDSEQIRTGGDEFIVLLHNILPEDIEQVTIRIHDAITTARFTVKNQEGHDQEESVGASIGVKLHRPGNSLENDINEADQAMYVAKTKKDSEARTIAIAPDFAQEVAAAQDQAAEEADVEAEPA